MSSKRRRQRTRHARKIAELEQRVSVLEAAKRLQDQLSLMQFPYVNHNVPYFGFHNAGRAAPLGFPFNNVSGH